MVPSLLPNSNLLCSLLPTNLSLPPISVRIHFFPSPVLVPPLLLDSLLAPSVCTSSDFILGFLPRARNLARFRAERDLGGHFGIALLGFGFPEDWTRFFVSPLLIVGNQRFGPESAANLSWIF